MGRTDNPAKAEVRVQVPSYRGRNPQVQCEHAKLSTNPTVSGTLQLMAAVAHQEADLAPIPPPRIPPGHRALCAHHHRRRRLRRRHHLRRRKGLTLRSRIHN